MVSDMMSYGKNMTVANDKGDIGISYNSTNIPIQLLTHEVIKCIGRKWKASIHMHAKISTFHLIKSPVIF